MAPDSLLPPPFSPFGVGDLVEVETASVRAVARVRECSTGGRLHVAFEMGEYLPWVDANVQIRHFGNAVGQSCTAHILHAGSTTALLQLIDILEVVPALEIVRAPLDTLPFAEE